MSKTVPNALYSELSEYSALLRALRTSNTQDLAAQLTHSIPLASTPLVDLIEEPIDENDLLNFEVLDESAQQLVEVLQGESIAGAQPVARPSQSSVPRKSSKRKRTPGGLVDARDTWTRWPLPAGEVPAPEWGLEDEVKILALQLLKAQPGERPHHAVENAALVTQEATPDIIQECAAAVATATVPDDIAGSVTVQNAAPVVESPSCSDRDGNADADDDDALSPLVLRALTASAASHLSGVLSALAAHVPVAEKSMHNRMRAIGWETILEVVGAYGLSNADSVDNVRRRMEAIYGPSKSYVVHRMDVSGSIIEQVRELVDPHGLDFLSLPTYAEQASDRRRKRGPYKKRKVKEESHPPQETGGTAEGPPEG